MFHVSHGPFFSHLLFYFLCFAFLAISLFYDCNLSSTVLRGKLLHIQAVRWLRL